MLTFGDCRVATKPFLWSSRKPGAKALYIPTASKVFLGISMLNRSHELWGSDGACSWNFFSCLLFSTTLQLSYSTPTASIKQKISLIPLSYSQTYVSLPRASRRPKTLPQVRYEEVSHFVIRLLQRFVSIALVPEAIPFAERPQRTPTPLSGDSSSPLERIKIENQVFLRSAVSCPAFRF